MPSINKIRLSNVLFDNNSRFYDDIVIPVNEGKLLIEAENGSGKTLLMQCILQAVRPLLFFRRKNTENDEQPTIKNLFRSNDNTYMHSMIEWALDDNSTHDYILTGFCAKKIYKETEEGRVQDISYFSYVVLYNAEDSFSLESIPLKTIKNGKVYRLTYSQLDKYLKDLDKNEQRFLVKIFHNKGDYESFLNSYNINSSEFEIMRNINLKEGGSEDYFTENYKTPYNFIVGELIGRIESVNKMKFQDSFKSEKDLAKSLMEIKKTMVDLKNKQEKKDEINIIEQTLLNIIKINDHLVDELKRKDITLIDIAKGLNSQLSLIDTIKQEIKDKESVRETKLKEADELTEKDKDYDFKIDLLEDEIKELNKELNKIIEFRNILKNREDKKKLLNEVKEYKLQLENIETLIKSIDETAKTISEQIKSVELEEAIKRNENLYKEYVDLSNEAHRFEKLLETANKDIKELVDSEKNVQGNLLYVFNQEINKIQADIDTLNTEIENLNKEKSSLKETISNNKVTFNTNQNKISTNNDAIRENERVINSNLTSLKQHEENLIKIIKDKENQALDLFNIADTIRTSRFELETIYNIAKDILDNIGSNNNENLNSLINTFKMKSESTGNDIQSNMDTNSDKILELEELDLELELKTKVAPLNERITKLNEDKSLYEQDIESIKRNLTDTEINISTKEDLIVDFKNEIEKISSTISKYSVSDRFELEETLNTYIDTTKKALFKIESDIEETSSTIEELENNKGATIPNTTKKCYEIVSKAYSSAILGIDFNKNLSIYEKERYLSLSNLIPIGIILNNNEYNSLLRNKTLLEKIDSYVVPFINIDKIKQGETDSTNVVYINSKDKEFYINEDKRKLQIDSLKRTLEKLEKEEALLQERLTEKESELTEVSRINLLYIKDFVEIQKGEIKGFNREIKFYNEEIEKQNSNIEKIDLEITNINEEIQVITIDINNKIADKNKVLRELRTDNNELSKLIVEVSSLKTSITIIESTISKELNSKESIHNLKSVINERTDANKELQANNLKLEEVNNNLLENNTNLELKVSHLNSNISNKTNNLNNLKVNKNGFDKELKNGDLVSHDTTPIATNHSIDELKAGLKAIRINKQSQNADIETYEHGLNTNRNNANFKKTNIDTKIVSIDELELRKNTLELHDIHVFNEIKDRLNKLKEDATKNNEESKVAATNKANIEGRIEQTIKGANELDTQEHIVIPEDYTPKEEEDKVKSIIEAKENERKNVRDLKKTLGEDIRQANNEIRKIEKDLNVKSTELNKLEIKKESIENLMYQNNISENKELGLYENGTFVVESYIQKLDRHNKNIINIEENHTNTIKYCLDSLKNSVFRIVEILEEIKPKNTISEVLAQNISIEEDCIKTIREIRESLDAELEQLDKLKETFINTCLEKTNNILNKLNKLQKLVTIEYEGVKKPLIKVNLHELSEEQKHTKMTYHINNVLGIIKADTTPEELESQANDISKQLSSSKLLEQVISSPKRCEVKIFVPKNESNVITNGSYVNWGGTASGGQRNVMYFTVTIALLLFTRELSTVGTATKQTKVLYVDGAFKASASTYLWECIYPLLVDNKIQLIVTNMGTPSSLMKLFDSVALLEGHQKQIGDSVIIENKIGQNSTFKADARTLKTDNILHNFGEYRIPKK